MIHVLDVGSGPGFLSIVLVENGYCVTACDYSEEMMLQAKMNAASCHADIDFRLENAEDLSFADASFDVVVSRNLTWNLQKPKDAYLEWLRVLKPKGLMLVFDANWYAYLRDEERYQAYEKDRQNVLASGYEDYNIGVDFDKMEEIADALPLTDAIRPGWDVDSLASQGIRQVEAIEDIGARVYSEKEKVNYGSTPMFMIKAIKG